ncbi:unnamed protein product [Heterobilharzia americana]|nr:unnamed protein product [Heterobilharzia americana]
MGNRLTCCRQTWIELHDGGLEDPKIASQSRSSGYRNNGADFSEEDSGLHVKSRETLINCARNSLSVKPVVAYNTTQHISEREPEDTEFDPSLNASQHTLFSSSIMGKSQESCRRFMSRSGKEVLESFTLKRWSSCSTIYVGDGCLARPDVNDMVWCVSVAIRLLMHSDLNKHFSKQLHSDVFTHLLNVYEEVYKTFDERVYPIEHLKCDENSKSDTVNGWENSEVNSIQQFLRSLFSTALLGPECAIVALIFLERLIIGAEVAMTSWTWRRQLLACVLLASKVLDDQAVWNIDYCQILRDIHVEDLNALERHTLRLLQFNINVPFAVYAKYYFDLLTVGENAGVANQISKRKRLTPERAYNFRILPIYTEICIPDKTVFDKGFLFDLPHAIKSETVCNGNVKKKDKIVENSTLVKGKKEFTQKKFIKTPFIVRNQLTNHDNQNNNVIPIDIYNHQSSNNVIIPLNESSLSPIELDDETDFVNSTPSSILKVPDYISQSKQIKTKYCEINQKFPIQSHPLLFSINCQKTTTPCINYSVNSPYEALDTLDSIQEFNGSHSLLSTEQAGSDYRDKTEFMRSLMGGDVAYSLLRDSGLY